MELIDTHCHLDVAAFDADRDQVLADCRDRGVTSLVVPGIGVAGWPRLVELCRQAGLHAALGLHPVFLDSHGPADIQALRDWIERERPVAVGEIGLDYQVDGLDHDRQQALFEAQLRVAQASALPVLLHVRKAHDAVLSTLARIPVAGGIVHAFNGSLPQAERYMALGFKFGFGGMLTYARSTRLRALAQALPAESLVLETDAPDMAVAAHHGERNSPAYLPECLAALAALRNETAENMAACTTRNARAVLRLN